MHKYSSQRILTSSRTGSDLIPINVNIFLSLVLKTDQARSGLGKNEKSNKQQDINQNKTTWQDMFDGKEMNKNIPKPAYKANFQINHPFS